MNKKILIKNALILTENYSLRKGSVFIDSSTIKNVFWHGAFSPDNQAANVDEMIDAEGMIVIPGLINAHYHSYSNVLKGTENDRPLELWALYTIAYGHSLDAEDIRLSVLLGAIEMIRHGITSCLDHFPHITHAISALEAYEQSGMRVAFAPMLQDIRDDQFFQIHLPEEIRRHLHRNKTSSYQTLFDHLIDEWHGKSGRIQITLGPNAPQRCSENLLLWCREMSERHQLTIHMHLLETLAQKRQIGKLYPNGIVAHLYRLGLLSSKLSVAHAVWLDENEIDLLKENDVSVVHNPVSNLMLGSGFAPVPTFLNKRINVALGTDSSNCGGTHQLFEAMRLAVMMQRTRSNYFHEWINEKDVFKMVTEAGTKLFPEQKIGKIAPGYKADLVMLKTLTSTWVPMNDVISQFVFQETGASVDSVMINGQWVMKNKKIVTIDEEDVLLRVKERQQKIIRQATDPLKIAKKQERYFVQVWKGR